MKERERMEMAVAAARETKAGEIVVFDMENRSTITDYVMICSGRSQAHVRGISDRIEEEMKKTGVRHLSVEGYQEGSWVLMDYDLVLVHIFHPETRAYYDLESLLKDFPRETFSTMESGPSSSGDDATSAA